MARKQLFPVDIQEELFSFDDEQEESDSDAGSMAASMDSEEEETFTRGIDVVLDVSETDSPFPPPRRTSTIPHSMGSPRTPHKASDRGIQNTGLPPKKRRVFTPTSPSPTSAGKQPSTRPRSTPTKSHTASPQHTAQEDRWHNASEEDIQPPRLPFCPKRTPGVQLDILKDYSPSDLFQLFFCKKVMQTLCNNTNKYAARGKSEGKKRHWTDINADEMLNYFSIIIYLGLIKKLSVRDMWRKDRLHGQLFPPTVMTGRRFEAISAYLHMSDPEEDAINDQLRGQPGYDGLFRLKPLHDQILTACQAHYHPRQNISVDERMVATKARIGMKQYMKDKPTKWGYKLFVLADSCNGFTCNFIIYEGKARRPSGNGPGFDAVVNLVHVPALGTGYNVYVDNFYTSSLLFRHLHGVGLGACGTIRENRIGFPKTTTNALSKKAARGDMRWIRKDSLLFVKWRDTRDVTMCSTIHKAYSGQSVQRQVRSQSGTWSTLQFPVPEPVREYNKFMGGVDLSDALIKYYSLLQKTRRWYVKLFLHFIDIAVVNSFIIHKELALLRQQKPLTQKSFREALCLELAEAGRPRAPTQARAGRKASMPSKPQNPEQTSQGCFPVPVCELSSEIRQKASQGRRKCVHCKMKTMFMCRSCSVPLCIVVDRMCFTEWHDQKST